MLPIVQYLFLEIEVIKGALSKIFVLRTCCGEDVNIWIWLHANPSLLRLLARRRGGKMYCEQWKLNILVLYTVFFHFNGRQDCMKDDPNFIGTWDCHLG